MGPAEIAEMAEILGHHRWLYRAHRYHRYHRKEPSQMAGWWVKKRGSSVRSDLV